MLSGDVTTPSTCFATKRFGRESTLTVKLWFCDKYLRIMATVADREISRLLEENRLLSQDLKNSQADKDFVWSLWKKLQVSNPDVTQAVGLVVQREQERCEARDRRVLEILQRKDERIEELQANLAYKQRELSTNTVK
ncbi:hypothetical protein DPMN_113594 [Dreissena polymorpha]|uniref:Uncharacterized protein n=1 Tax=Dreissena polymorpha TaxID=45954 RepID=A0A9D4QS03_DREPO|nr:hypothetical protein DPMN_113594 [Dreissena polymorpha]